MTNTRASKELRTELRTQVRKFRTLLNRTHLHEITHFSSSFIQK